MPDPEIPVVSVVDLGIVRDVQWQDPTLVVTVTPTYSGCPATAVIALEIENALRAHGVEHVRLERRLSPPWTTEWISATGQQQLREYGIAPPQAPGAAVECPRCGSADTDCISRFGSTPCKAQYRCRACLEPFDHFKCF